MNFNKMQMTISVCLILSRPLVGMNVLKIYYSLQIIAKSEKHKVWHYYN